MSLWSDDVDIQIYIVINFFAVIIGCLASLICIVLIYRMKVFTGHMHLLILISFYQFIYDFFCLESNLDVTYDEKIFASFADFISGVASSIISNWISFCAYYIVVHKKVFDVLKYYHYIHMSALIPGIMVSVPYYIGAIQGDDDVTKITVLYVYNNVRIISIAINFVLIMIILFRIYSLSSHGAQISDQELAIRTLARRMILYPVVQAISRSGYAWYEYQYSNDAFIEPDSSDPTKYTCLIFLSVVTPIASVGYLVIFLIMQPKAYDHFKAMICCRPLHTNPDAVKDTSLFSIHDIKSLYDKSSKSSNANSIANISAPGTMEAIEEGQNMQSMFHPSYTKNPSLVISGTLHQAIQKYYELRTDDELMNIVQLGPAAFRPTNALQEENAERMTADHYAIEGEDDNRSSSSYSIRELSLYRKSVESQDSVGGGAVEMRTTNQSITNKKEDAVVNALHALQPK